MLMSFAAAAKAPRAFALTAVQLLFGLKAMPQPVMEPSELTVARITELSGEWASTPFPGTDSSPPEEVLFPRLIKLIEACEIHNQSRIELIIQDLIGLWPEEVEDISRRHAFLKTQRMGQKT